MNERNVEALYEAILSYNATLATLDAASDHDLAQFLAARGVLVPAALTDEECWDVQGRCHDGESCMHDLDVEEERLRETLARTAKGEPA